MLYRLFYVPLAVALTVACGQADGQEVVYAGTVSGGMVSGSHGPQELHTVLMDPSNWHAGYYHTAWGQPLALVIPPTVTHQTNWGWGIGNTRVTPVFPQYMGPMTASVSQYQYGPHRPTPYYVSDTLHFGVYYIRGPW